jgi:hypothetical protein
MSFPICSNMPVLMWEPSRGPLLMPANVDSSVKT